MAWSMNTLHLVRLAETLADHRKLALSTISTYAAKDGKFFTRLRDEDAGCTLKTADRLLKWFDSAWPNDLEWPREVPRPPKDKREAA